MSGPMDPGLLQTLAWSVLPEVALNTLPQISWAAAPGAQVIAALLAALS